MMVWEEIYPIYINLANNRNTNFIVINIFISLLKLIIIMKNIVLFGAPGAGKGTQAVLLKERYNLIHISTGEVFRYNIKKQTELGKLAKTYIDKTQLVPDEVTINMLIAEVERFPNANGFIFDGFPRTRSQAETLDKYMNERDQEINAMIILEVPEDILIKRILSRGLTSGRSNDQSEDKIKIRLQNYYDNTDILKDFYQKQNKYNGIDGVGTVEEIRERIQQIVDKF